MSTNTHNKGRYFWLGIAMGGAIAFSVNCAQAQVTPDGTLPNNSTVKLEGNTRTIEGGSRAGGNLFHSFREFSVPPDSTAFFNNGADIQNIISRVTGGSVSNINGLIRANGTANLFLINPSSIIFGENARLDIGGSFIASTANSIKFADGTQFNTETPESTPLLTVNVPIGLQLGANSGRIEVQGTGIPPDIDEITLGFGDLGLQVPFEKTLALVGGNVLLTGGILQAPGGRVELGGLVEAGTVNLNEDGSLSFPEAVTQASVSLTNRTGVNISAGDKGSLAITAQNIHISDGSLLRGGIETDLGFAGAQAENISLNATGTINLVNSFISNYVRPGAVGNGGDINITAGSLSVKNTLLAASTLGQGNTGSVNINARNTISFDESDAFSNVEFIGAGNGGNVNIVTGSLILTNRSGLSVSNNGRGNAGNVNINADDTISFDGRSTVGGGVGFEGIGNGGNVNITTQSLAMTNRAEVFVSTYGQGNAGSVNIKARDTISFDGSLASSYVDSQAVGNGGDINITAGSLSLVNGAQLLATTYGQGNAGSVNINARDTVSFDGVGSNRLSNAAFSGAFSNVEFIGAGNSGGINITTGSFSLTNGAKLSSSTFAQGNAGNMNINARDIIFFDRSSVENAVRPGAVGNGGDINITTGSLTLNGTQLIASTFGQGNTGNVNIEARDSVSLVGLDNNGAGSGVFTTVEAEAVGNSGNLNITTGSLFVADGAGGLVASTYGQGNAGNVNINARDIVSFDGVTKKGFASGAFSTVESGAVGNGNNVNITTRSLFLKNGAVVSARTRGQGNGGNININANTLEAINGGQVITTSSSSGKAGNVNLNVTDSIALSGRDSTYSNRLALLGKELIDNVDSASGLFANTSETSTGQGGNLKITTGHLIVQDGAQISVNGLGSGSAGNLEATTESIRLNQGTISADTQGGEGNINLHSRNFLILGNGGKITTNARGSNVIGGNINIDTDFLVAFKNSDISANSTDFRGGRVKINTQANFGIKYRNTLTSESDITATGASPDLSGHVIINTPEVDPSRGLVQLPTNLVDISNQIDTACNPGSRQLASSFMITGRGGLPLSPTEPLQDFGTLAQWVRPRAKPETSPQTQDHKQITQVSTTLQVSSTTPIVEANGWVVDANGDILLVAQAPNVNQRSSWQTPTSCTASQ